MLVLQVKGGSKAKRKKVTDAAYYAYLQLLPRRRKPVWVEINIDRIDKEFEGLCYENTEDEYVIEISNKIKSEDLITAIFHEMIHMKQGIKRELTEKQGKQYWKGEDHSDTEYYDQPWEIEAYQLQEKLLEKYKKSSFLQKKGLTFS